MGRKKFHDNPSWNDSCFRRVTQQYRRLSGRGSVQAVDYATGGGGGSSTFNQSRPRAMDFRSDVELAFKAVLKRSQSWPKVRAAFLTYDFDDAIAQFRFAEHILGTNTTLSIIQRAGEEFRKRGLQHGYFETVRRRVAEHEIRRPAPVYVMPANVRAAYDSMAALREKLASQKPKGKKKVAPEIKFEVEQTNRFFVGLETDRFEDVVIDDVPFARQAEHYEEAVAQ